MMRLLFGGSNGRDGGGLNDAPLFGGDGLPCLWRLKEMGLSRSFVVHWCTNDIKAYIKPFTY
jgi:hypothetical protein